MLNFFKEYAEQGCSMWIFSVMQCRPLLPGFHSLWAHQSSQTSLTKMWFTLTYKMPLLVGSHQPHQSEARVLGTAGPSEQSHCGCSSSLRRLHFMTEIKHLACSRIAFENYALMIATQASSLVIFLWPLSRASQFGHFFNKYFLGAYHVLGTMQSSGCSSG